MDITPLISPNKKVIISYGDEKINVSNKIFTENLIIYDEETYPWQANVAEIEFKSFSNFLDSISKVPEILLIGVGNHHQSLNLDLKNQFKNLSISVEMMTSGAACRTFNILIAEGREVALAVILV